MTKFFVGTTGWSYLKWDKEFYPKGTKTAEKLAYYAEQFNAIELNNSFYHLPKPEQFISWEEQVPDDFLFAVKAPQYITHTKKLKEVAEPLHDFSQAVSVQQKNGPLFFQLPPKLAIDLERLNAFLKQLPKSARCTIEFRHNSWHDEAVYDLLRQHNVAFCLYDIVEDSSPKIITADFTYLRLLGRDIARLSSFLHQWKDWLSEHTNEAYVFFHNHENKSLAFGNAQIFKNLADEEQT